MVKYCPNCGAESKDEFVYCAKCGSKFNLNRRINNSYSKKSFINKKSLMYNFKLKILVIIGLIFSITHLINNFYLLKIFTEGLIFSKNHLQDVVISNNVKNTAWDTSILQARVANYQGFETTFLIITFLFIMVVILASISLVYIHNKDSKAKKILFSAGVLSFVSLIPILYELNNAKTMNLSTSFDRTIFLFVNSYSYIYLICIVFSIIFYFAAVLLYNRFNNQEFSINFKEIFNKFKLKFFKRFDFIKRNKKDIYTGIILTLCIVMIITVGSMVDLTTTGKNVIKVHADDNINGTIAIQEFTNLSKTSNGSYDLKLGHPVLKEKNIEIKNGEGRYEIPGDVDLFVIDKQVYIFDKEYPIPNTEKKITTELWHNGIKIRCTIENIAAKNCWVGINGFYDNNCTRICDATNPIYTDFFKTFF